MEDVKEFSTKLNSLGKYVLNVVNLERDKLNVFIEGLRPNIAKYVMIGDNPPKSFFKALS